VINKFPEYSCMVRQLIFQSLIAAPDCYDLYVYDLYDCRHDLYV
jgi:hypothetical protein